MVTTTTAMLPRPYDTDDDRYEHRQRLHLLPTTLTGRAGLCVFVDDLGQLVTKHDEARHARRHAVAIDGFLGNGDFQGSSAVEHDEQLLVWRTDARLTFERMRDAVAPHLDDVVGADGQ